MTLQGIDISNWQSGIDIDEALDAVDFCIMKATGGTHFVDGYCDEWVQACISKGKLWGFYHFANDGYYSNARDEADFFYANCQNYFYHGIPILDWEVDVDSDWVNEFVNRIHELTGVWCWIYGNAWRFSNGDVEPNCGRWVAAYPGWIFHPQPGFNPGEPPECDGLVCAWQYASDGDIPGYYGNVDMDIYYGDEKSWGLYANPNDDEPEPMPIPPEKDEWVLENAEWIVTIRRK